jgi:hypothetical protein
VKYLVTPQVQRITTDDGSHIEPPLEQDWPEASKIAWAAAVCAADTGLTVEVFEHRGGEYSFRFGRHNPYPSEAMRVGTINSGGPYSYNLAWIYLNAVSVAVKASRLPTESSWTERSSNAPRH